MNSDKPHNLVSLVLRIQNGAIVPGISIRLCVPDDANRSGISYGLRATVTRRASDSKYETGDANEEANEHEEE